MRRSEEHPVEYKLVITVRVRGTFCLVKVHVYRETLLTFHPGVVMLRQCFFLICFVTCVGHCLTLA